MIRWLRRFVEAHGLYSAVGDFWLFIKFALPYFLGVVALFAGRVQGLGVMYCWLGFLAAIALGALALNQLASWRSKNSPRFKVRLEQVEMGIGITVQSDVRSVGFLQPSFHLKNIGDFPVRYVVTRCTATLGNRFSDMSSGRMINNGGLIEPQATTRFTTPQLDVAGADFSIVQEGRLEIEIRYGRAGNENQNWSRHLTYTLIRETPTDAAQQHFGFTWYDAPQVTQTPVQSS